MVNVDSLARLALFADLTTPQLEEVGQLLDEERYAPNQRIVRAGLSGSPFHIVLEGFAAVLIDGTERAQLGTGDFFGEVSVLTGDNAVADVVALGDGLCCAILAGTQLRPLLVRHPTIAIRMLEIGARRLRA